MFMDNYTKRFREELAESFISVLSDKKLNWKNGWNVRGLPLNASTDKRYRGINQFKLMFTSAKLGYSDPRWATFKQIVDNNWKLKKGSKGEKVEYWLPYSQDIKKAISWDDYNKLSIEDKNKCSLIAKYYTVFNADDIVGIPKLEKKEIIKIEEDVLVNKISKNMNIKIINEGERAFYSITTDTIHLPKMDSFNSTYEYNSTALHELAHATGHSTRLNREFNNLVDDKKRAYEELIAEITACFMSAELSVEQNTKHIDNHKAYVQSWIQQIKEKPETLISAIREAEKVSNYLDYKAEIITKLEYEQQINKTITKSENKIIYTSKANTQEKSLSDLCDKAFEKASMINNEHTNKNFKNEIGLRK